MEIEYSKQDGDSITGASLTKLAVALDTLHQESCTGNTQSRRKCEGLCRKATDMAQLLDTALTRTPGLNTALSYSLGPPGEISLEHTKALERVVKAVNAAMARTLHPALHAIMGPAISGLNASAPNAQSAANVQAMQQSLVEQVAVLLGTSNAAASILKHINSAVYKLFGGMNSAFSASCHKMLASVLPLRKHTFVVKCANPGPNNSPGPSLRDVDGQTGIYTAIRNLTLHVLNEVPGSLVDKTVKAKIHDRVLGAMFAYHNRPSASKADEHRSECMAAIQQILFEELKGNEDVDVGAVWTAVSEQVLNQYLKAEWLYPRDECTDSSVQVTVKCYGIFQAVVLLRKPGSCDPVGIIIGPDSPTEKLDPWAAPSSVLFERLTALASRALSFFRDRAALGPSALPGAQALEDVLYWLALYRNAAPMAFREGAEADPKPVPHLFAASCLLSDCILAMDAPSGSLIPPLLRPYRLPSSFLRQLACENTHAVSVYHLSEVYPDLL